MSLCPRCQQPLPDAAVRFCIHCGAPVDAAPAEAAPPTEPEPVEPAEAAAPSAALVPAVEPPAGEEGTPWDRRGEVGFFTGLVDTTLQVLSRPREFYRRMSVRGGVGGPLLYCVLVGYMGLLATAVYDAIFEALVGRQTPELG